MLNQAQIIGRVVKDPETRYTAAGDPVVSFSVATSEKWTDRATGEKKEATEWHNITVFGALATVCETYLTKGSLVFIQGKITTRKYTDKSGIERYATGIQADKMQMLGGREDRGEQPQSNQSATKQPTQPVAGVGGMDDDIPF